MNKVYHVFLNSHSIDLTARTRRKRKRRRRRDQGLIPAILLRHLRRPPLQSHILLEKSKLFYILLVKSKLFNILLNMMKNTYFKVMNITLKPLLR